MSKVVAYLALSLRMRVLKTIKLIHFDEFIEKCIDKH